MVAIDSETTWIGRVFQNTALLVLICAAPAFAQNADVQKQLIQRQQQSDAFNLQLRQSQESLKASSAGKSEREARQISERQRLDNVSEKQLRDVKPDSPPEFRPQERQRADDERRPLTIPAGGIVQPGR
jgi:hypothetical protein